MILKLLLPQLTLPDDNIPSTRRRHSVTAISLAPGLTEVTMFGGSTSVNDHSRIALALTTIMTFGELNPCPHRVYKEGVNCT